MGNDFNLTQKIKNLCSSNRETRAFFNKEKQDFDIIDSSIFYKAAAKNYFDLKDFIDEKSIVVISASSTFATLLGFYTVILSRSTPLIIPNKKNTGSNTDYGCYLNIIEKSFQKNEIAILTDNIEDMSQYLNIDQLDLHIFEMPYKKISDIQNSDIKCITSKIDSIETNNSSAFYQMTSGTVSEKKLIEVSHSNIYNNTKAIFERSKCGKYDIAISWLPLHHDMGLVGAELFCLINNLPLYLMSPLDFIRSPENWFLMVSKYSCSLSPFPNLAYEYCLKNVDIKQLRGIDISSLRVLYNGSEPINVSTLFEFYKLFSPLGLNKDVFLTCYGMAECTLAATMPHKNEMLTMVLLDQDQHIDFGVKIKYTETKDLLSLQNIPTDKIILPALGSAMDGMEITIVNEKGNRQKEGHLGEILIRGNSIALDVNKEKNGRPGTFATGDLGLIINNNLYFVDRISNLVSKNKKRYSPNILENIIGRTLSISPRQVIVFELPNESKVIAIIESNPPLEPNSFKKIIKNIGLTLDCIIIYRKRIIPRTTSGKKQYFLCSTLYENSLKNNDTSIVAIINF